MVGSQQNADAAAAAPRLVVMTRSYASPPNTPVKARTATHIESASAGRWMAMARRDAFTQVSRAELAAAERWIAMNSQYTSSQTEAARWNALARHDAASQAQVFNIIPVTGGAGGSASDAVLPVQEMAALSAADASAYHWNLMVRYYTNQL